MQRSLARSLKLATQTLHAQVEQSPPIRALIGGQISRSAYCALLRNLYEIYVALEAALSRHALHPLIAPVFSPPLFRANVLAADLFDLHGEGWMVELEVARSTLIYVERLSEIESMSPELLVAHAYVRYLGDLSGGQLLKLAVQQNHALSPQHSARFFDFGSAQEIVKMTHEFRTGLDAIASDGGSDCKIVAEAQLAFALHARLFEELACASVS